MNEFLCKWFGHKWKCSNAFDSCCKRCGIGYTEYIKENKKEVNEHGNTKR